MSDYVERYRRAHEAFNRRDWDGVIADFGPQAHYTDHARGVTVKSPQEFVDYLRDGWATSFTDARVTEVSYLDAGDHVVARFTGTGTQDGPLGPLPASGKRISLPFCEILRYDDTGQVIAGELYYDQMTMLAQLGHVPPPSGGTGA